MKALDALKQAAQASGTPITHIGRIMGKSDNYVSKIATRGSTPQTDTMVKMLDACGYKLYAMPSDEKAPSSAILIDG